jgi:hypothetical protein
MFSGIQSAWSSLPTPVKTNLTSAWTTLSAITPDEVKKGEGSSKYVTLANYQKASWIWKLCKAVIDTSPISKGIVVGSITSQISYQITNTGTSLSGMLAGASAYSIVALGDKSKNLFVDAVQEASFLGKTALRVASIAIFCPLMPSQLDSLLTPVVSQVAQASLDLLRKLPVAKLAAEPVSALFSATPNLASSIASTTSLLFSSIFPWKIEVSPIQLGVATGLSFLGSYWVQRQLSILQKDSRIAPTLEVMNSSFNSVKKHVNFVKDFSPFLLTCCLNDSLFTAQIDQSKISSRLLLSMLAVAHIAYNLKWPRVQDPDPKAKDLQKQINQNKTQADAQAKEITKLQAIAIEKIRSQDLLTSIEDDLRELKEKEAIVDNYRSELDSGRAFGIQRIRDSLALFQDYSRQILNALQEKKVEIEECLDSATRKAGKKPSKSAEDLLKEIRDLNTRAEDLANDAEEIYQRIQ